MWPLPLVDHADDLGVQLDVGVVVLRRRESVSSDIHFPRLMYYDEEDLCLVTHQPKVASHVLKNGDRPP